jgi:ACS family hexuronate transporter-like MFS transporter
MTLPADLFPKRTVGTANGLSGSAALAGGMLFTFAVGWLVTHVGYAPIFVTIAFLDLIGATLLWTLIREPKTETSSITA